MFSRRYILGAGSVPEFGQGKFVMGKASKDVGTVITAKTRFPPSRRPPRPKTQAEISHIRHIGEVVHAWNQAHGALFHVFSLVAAESDILLAHALWHSIKSDNGQRMMPKEVVKVKFQNPQTSFRTAIFWAVSALDALGTYRNDAAHVEIIAGHSEIIPGMSSKHSSQDRLEKSPLSQHWQLMRGDLYAIVNYLDGIYLGLWQGFPRPLSRRPKLLFANITSDKTQNQRRRTKKINRDKQRKASGK